MVKKLIAFDLDDTLAVTKSPISDRMSELLVQLLERYEVCIISGGKFELFKRQVIDRLTAETHHFDKLHLMPTCGTRYMRYDSVIGEWVQRYSEDLTDSEKAQIAKIVEIEAKKLGLWDIKTWGEKIEDRGSQVTYSVLGQEAPAVEKYKWSDENADIKLKLRTAIAEKLPELEARLGGTTSVDITRIGIDKAYGMEKLKQELGLANNEIIFIGDKLSEGGNDYPVKAMGIDSIAVEKWEDTALVVEALIFAAG